MIEGIPSILPGTAHPVAPKYATKGGFLAEAS
jgi:hypothetical protein